MRMRRAQSVRPAVRGRREAVRAHDGAIDAGTATYTPQDNSQATHTAKIYKEMGSIDWKQGAKEIECLIRGLDPWPSAIPDWAIRC